MIKYSMSLPGGIERREIPGGVRYLLPKRPGVALGQFIPFVFALVLSLVGVIYLWIIPERNLFTFPRDPRLSRLWGVLPLAAGGGMLMLGLFLAYGRLEIEWTPARFLVRSRAFFLSWTRSRAAGGLRILTAVQIRAGEGIATPPFDAITAMGILRASWEGGGSMHVASAYPPSWLHALAQDLAGYLGGAVTVERIGPDLFDTTESGGTPQPAGSRAVLRRNPEGLVLVLPPRGIRQGSAGYLWGGIGWLATIASLDFFCFLGMRNEFLTFIGVSGALLVFSVAGFVMIGAAIHLGRQRVTFDVSGGRLKLSIDGPFGKPRYEWDLRELDAIRCGPSGHRSNDIPTMALCIHPRMKYPEKHLEGRDPMEIRWIASVLAEEARKARGGQG